MDVCSCGYRPTLFNDSPPREASIMTQRTRRRLPLQLLAVAMIAMTLAGCVTHPEPLQQRDMAAFASDRLARVTTDQEHLRSAVTLYEAMARALKYNLDTRVEMAQTALKIKELDLAEYKLLPSVVTNSGYAGRDNTSASVSENVATRRIGADFTSSTERNPLTADLTLSWNVLDFGLSYVRAQQLGDEALIAAEARRRVANRVVEDVRTAYWRAVTHQRLIARLRGLEGRALRARAAARTLYNEGQTQPMLALAYERELVEVRREIQKVEGELIAAKAQLAALMNVEPATPFTLVDARSGNTLALKLPADRLVAMALENRPEVREVAYRMRINQKEATAALLELLPGAQLYLGGNFDGSRFLLNNNWLGYGAKASWNLLKIAQFPARKELIDANDKLLDERALALTMAIMTQVHVSRARYAHAQRELQAAADYLNVQNDILAQIRSQAATDRTGEQALIREEMNALLAEVRFDLAHAQLQNAFAGVYSALGLDPFDDGIDLAAGLGTIADKLKTTWRKRGDFVGLKSANLLRAPRQPKPVAVLGALPPMPGAANTGVGGLLPPMPAPGGVSRSIGGAFVQPRLPDAPLTTQSVPERPAAPLPQPGAEAPSAVPETP
jgi:outer membrane protein TolC